LRKVIALEFITLDGVIQAGGGPEEDTSGIIAVNFSLASEVTTVNKKLPLNL